MNGVLSQLSTMTGAMTGVTGALLALEPRLNSAPASRRPLNATLQTVYTRHTGLDDDDDDV